MNRRSARRVVLGIGNPLRGDDGVGPALIEMLRGRVPAEIELIHTDGEAAALLGWLERAREAYLLDACRSGAAAGTVRRFDLARQPVPVAHAAHCTHDLGLAEVIELARALGGLPGRCVLYAIEAHSCLLGRSLSAPLRAALPSLAQRLAVEIGACERARRCSRQSQCGGRP